MKKRTKSLAALIASVLLVAVVFTACGGGGNNNAPADNAAGASVAGTYHAQLDMGSMLNEEMADSGFTISDPIMADMALDLKDDNSFTLSLDGETLAANFTEYFKTNGAELFTNLLEAQGLSADMLDAAVASSGYDSLDAMIEDMSGQLAEELKSSLEADKDKLSVSGSYSVDGTTLKLSGKTDSFSVENGTINDDGSITINMKLNDSATDIVFTK